MQQIVRVITPADTFSLMSLEEMKTALGIEIDDVSEDDQLQFIIELSSNEVASRLNRVLAFEKVEETFLNACGRRLFLSRYPVKREDIESLTLDDDDILSDTDWVLEEYSGILHRKDSTWSGTVVVTYSGGYQLPEEAPAALKQASVIVGRDQRNDIVRGDSSVRMISHKESRVMYFSPDQMTVKSSGGSSISSSTSAIESLLVHFRRYYV
jgi:hypothetical protein